MENIDKKVEEEVLKCRSYKIKLIWSNISHSGTIYLYNSKSKLVATNKCTKKETLNAYRRIVEQCLKDKSLSLRAKIRDCQD